MNASLYSWFSEIVAYFRFVQNRKVDHRFGLMPAPLYLLSGVMIIVLITLLLYLYADPVLLAWLRSDDRWYPAIFETITLLGNVDWFLVIAGTVLAILSVFNAKRFTGNENLVWHRIFLNAYFAFTAIVFTGLLGNLLKNLIGRARPKFTPDSHIWFSMPFEHHYQFASFPSGHSTTGGAIAMVLSLLFPRWTLLFMAGGIMIAVSRAVLGVHFLSDIFAGFVFGSVFVWLYARLFARKRLLFTFDHEGRLVLRGEQWFKPMLYPRAIKDES